MAIAITPFEGLCGFRPLAEIEHFLNAIAPLRRLVGGQAAEEFEMIVHGSENSQDPAVVSKNKDALRAIFTSLVQSPRENHPHTFGTMADSPDTNPTDPEPQQLAEAIVRLNRQFPADIGLFVFFFLNFVTLVEGEAMFLKADDIHAYISGDIIECMASSDNVVRAGFTPKFKDVSTLTHMLTYSYAPIEEQKLQPVNYPYVVMNATAYSSASDAVLYDPPIEEFNVVKTDLNRGGAKATFDSIPGPSILICIRGRGTITVGSRAEEVREGYVFFVGANAVCVIENTGGREEAFTTYKAFCELEEESMMNGHAE